MPGKQGSWPSRRRLTLAWPSLRWACLAGLGKVSRSSWSFFGLPDLLRNSPSTVLAHYNIGLVKVQLPSLDERTFQERDLYLVTGKEKLPLPGGNTWLQQGWQQTTEVGHDCLWDADQACCQAQRPAGKP